MWDVDWRSNGWIWTRGFGGVMKWKVLVESSRWIFERRIGWEFWRSWRAFWRIEMFGGLEKRKPNTVIPVPPGTALHQLNSVPPTGRVVDSVIGLGCT